MKNITISLLAITLAISFGTAYAEESTVDVPFDIAEQNCIHLVDPDTNREHYRCFWSADIMEDDYSPTELIPKYTLPNCADIGLVYDPDTDNCITSEALEQEAKENSEIYVEPVVPTEAEKQVQSLQNKYKQTDDDKKTLLLLEKLGAVCKYDIDTIQTYFEFEVATEQFLNPETEKWEQRLARDFGIDNTNYESNNVLKKLNLAIEACRGQNTLPETLSERYDHMVVEDEYTPAPYHADAAVHVQPISQSQLENIENEGKIHSERFHPACEYVFSDRDREYFGCPKIEHEPGTGEIPELTYSQATLDILDSVKKLKQGEYAEQLEKISKEALAEAQRKIYSQNNP